MLGALFGKSPAWMRAILSTIGISGLTTGITRRCPVNQLVGYNSCAPENQLNSLNIKTEVSGSFEQVLYRLTAELMNEGFGILTRIDLHEKLREKLRKEIPATTILGVCNPQFAYDSYLLNPAVSSVLPCNAVIREIVPGRYSVEISRPSALIELLEDPNLTEIAEIADQSLEICVERLALAQAA